MILENFENLENYYGLSEKIDVALKYLHSMDKRKFDFEKKNIPETNIIVMIHEYETKNEEECNWESHKKYIDIQYMAVGVEKMGYAHISSMKPVKEYDSKNDVIFYEGSSENYFVVNVNDFAIFMPNDVHKPSLKVNGGEKIKKIVFKIPVE